jgi:hypothetical protein
MVHFLPALTFNSFFISEFAESDHLSAAVGIVEEHGVQKGFMAFKPDRVIPGEFTQKGINFGHQLIGSSLEKVSAVRFSVEIYNYKQFHLFMNPNSTLVRKVLHLINDSNEIFHFIFNDRGLLTFKDEIEGNSKYWFNRNLAVIDEADTTEEEYLKVLKAAEKETEGTHLNWICRNNMKYMDLSDEKYRYELKPA